MKKILFAIMFVSSISFADSGNKDYCADSSRRVLYTNLDVEQVRGYISMSAINTAALITNLSDGASVIVPCFNQRSLLEEGVATTALILDKKNIFIPVNAKSVNGSRIVGVNYEQAVYLVEKTTALLLKNYKFEKSEILLKLKAEKLKRSIDKR